MKPLIALMAPRRNARFVENLKGLLERRRTKPDLASSA